MAPAVELLNMTRSPRALAARLQYRSIRFAFL
jgi:hypothetical protein